MGNRIWETACGKMIRELPHLHKRKVDKLFGLLEEYGPHQLSLPHNKNLGEGLYELRDTSTGPGYRIYYGVHGLALVILVAAGDKRPLKNGILKRQENAYKTMRSK